MEQLCIQVHVPSTNANLLSVLRSTLSGLEDDAPADGENAGVSGLKRSVVRAVADLELRKLQNERFEHAAEIAAVLAHAGRAAYVIHPATEAATLTAPDPDPAGQIRKSC